MIPLKQENLKELTEKVLDLVAKTSVEIGHRSDAQTLASLSKIFLVSLYFFSSGKYGSVTEDIKTDLFSYFLLCVGTRSTLLVFMSTKSPHKGGRMLLRRHVRPS